MQELSVLGHVALGYSPMIDRQRAVAATRLTVFPDHGVAEVDADALLRALDEVWPPGTETEAIQFNLRPMGRDGTKPGAASHRPPVCLNIAGEALLQSVMAAAPCAHRMIEVPAFLAADPAHAQALRGLHDAGVTLLIKGRPLVPLAPELLACFTHSIVEADDERRGVSASSPGLRQVSTVQAGALTVAEVEAAFQRGAVAVLGWQSDEVVAPPKPGRRAVANDIQVVLELISGVDREEPVSRLEAILKRDPALAFRLLRYLNSAAFGLTTEINSFAHALMLLGYQKLKRWLTLLLASSSKDAYAKPLIFASVRRGLLMEELGRGNGDAEMRGEMFICGVFSLLDRLLQQPLDELLASVPVPQRVRQALRAEGGPFLPYLDLVRAIEGESLFDIRECREKLFMGPAEVNVALLNALRVARQID